MTDVEFTTVVKERTVDVFLHDEGALRLLFLFLLRNRFALRDDGVFYYLVKLVYLIDNCNSSTLIGVLSRFNNPNIPQLWFLLLLSLLFDLLRPCSVVLNEPIILWIFKSLLYMKSKWDKLKRIHVLLSIILS